MDYLRLDRGDPADVRRFAAELTERYPGLNVVIDPRAAIVNVTSALAFVSQAVTPTYCATKAALHSYTQSQATEIVADRAEPLWHATHGQAYDELYAAINPAR